MEQENSLQSLEAWIEENALAEYVLLASLAVLLVSSYSIYSIQGSVESFDEASASFDRLEQDLDSAEFNRTLETLESVEGSDVEDDFSSIVSTLEEADSSVERLRDVRDNLRRRATVYRWLNLLAFLAVLLGFSLLLWKDGEEEE